MPFPIHRLRRFALAPAALGLALLAAGCGDDNNAAGPSLTRRYDQVQRLGNPLVSEVILEKRNHPLHGSIGPDEDVAFLSAEIKNFVATVGGRSQAVQDGVAGTLLPDMLIVQTDKDPSTAGYLSWALSNGWGGRQLADDVLDISTLAVFGPVFDANGQTPGLIGDHVDNDSPFTTTFPYLAAPNLP